MLTRYEIIPSLDPNYDGPCQWIDPSDIPAPILACLDDPAKSAALGVMAEALPGLLAVNEKPRPPKPVYRSIELDESTIEAVIMVSELMDKIIAAQATKEETK